jgi:haloalkane dehalogenase
LELYRSGDFEKLEAYEGRLAALGLPALILWGEHDPFAPVAGAHRFARELPGSRMAVVDAGHFVFEDEPERCASEVVAFLGDLDS